MMGQQPWTESLFYYFRLEEQIPGDHLLRLIDCYVDFSFVREQLKGFYSAMGRPSIDPEVLLRLLVVGYLYGITSERRLMEEVRMHLAYRWFTCLSFDQEIPDHSTFSKNRHGRFRQSGVFRRVFEEIVQRCLEAGLVEGQNLAVDGTLVGANASQQSRVPRERLAEIARVSRTVQEYLKELEQENPVTNLEQRPIAQEKVSTTDPDGWARETHRLQCRISGCLCVGSGYTSATSVLGEMECFAQTAGRLSRKVQRSAWRASAGQKELWDSGERNGKACYYLVRLRLFRSSPCLPSERRID